MAKDVAERKVAALKVERQGHRTKKSAILAKLKEEIGHYQHEIIERDGQIKYLAEEVKRKNRARIDAHECA
ncbi:uncharacterized protein A4U43_C04F22020 [Asparagus officinalis]|uniref:Uncharacterized protein n=1 Tax=Asparagus officinalis TaxID=4686 RepID=A0A5P1F2V7_ASPOF|nr:uncharacterized protein A4U43_C04F22020 [Asparagus officinalis]